MFQEVFEPKQKEMYGHYTINTKTGKITNIDTNKIKGVIIDPVAFAYDFGARMYDARLGRWLSLDPLQAKYPQLSPYSFCNNNPVIYKDFDGRDYILVIDHKAKTITIVANYYVVEGDVKSRQAAIAATDVWNDASGKFSYVVGSGSNEVKYKVNFQLNVIETKDPVDAANKDAKGNSFQVNDVELKKEEDKQGNKLDGNTQKGKHILLKSNPTTDNSEEHEIGHTLGLPHFETLGFMVEGGLPFLLDDNIQLQYVQKILKNQKIGLATKVNGLNDVKKEVFSSKPANGSVEETNTVNKSNDFNYGEVKLTETPKFQPPQ